jgi:serine/threonine protein phosphatase PrpC/RNA polymerase subunit RPABC4/transcription elongation factor Spt4
VTTTACPHCGESVEAGASFCEACGKPLTDAASTPAPVAAPASEARPIDDLGSGPISAPTRQARTAEMPPPGTRPCLSCGGVVGDDGYCESCGVKALSERDHFEEQPASWVAGVCDKGIRHPRNEDAMALQASASPGDRAVLVVLDGVSNTEDSQAGSLAGAKAALEVLRTPLPQGMGTPDARRAAVTSVFTESVARANEGVVAATTAGTTHPASATYVAAVLEGGTVWFANIGDSRAYWLPDAGSGTQLSVDDSGAQEQMAAGATRVEAENGPMAHAITRWLGTDAPDLVPRVGSLDVAGPGWLLVCSDGLWNYASEPADLDAQVTAAGTTEPLALARALVAFANAQGGQDNITATLARLEAPGTGQNADTDHAPGESHG